MSTTQKDDNLLILSEDATTLDFGVPEELENKEELKTTEENDDFAFTIEEDETPLVVEDSTKNSLSDLMLDLTPNPEKELLEEKEELKVLEENGDDSLDLIGDFSMDLTEDNDSDFKIEEVKEEENNFELGGNELNEEVEELKIEEEKPQESFSNEVVEVLPTNSNSSQKNVGDMSDILERTIGEFTERENILLEDISEREKHISDLESELNTEKELVSDLKDEKNAIEKNRKSLEKMKTDFENREEEKAIAPKK